LVMPIDVVNERALAKMLFAQLAAQPAGASEEDGADKVPIPGLH